MAPKTTETAPFVKQVGKFSFAPQRGVVIPETIPTAPRDTLPFPDIFAHAEHNDYYFIPSSFWTSSKADGGREIPAERATLKWQKDKVKGAMNDWRKKDVAARKGYAVICINRTKGQPLDANDPKKGEYKEDGIGFWVTIEKTPAE